MTKNYKNQHSIYGRLKSTIVIIICLVFAKNINGQTTPNRLAQLIQSKKTSENFKSVAPFIISKNEVIYSKVIKGSVFTVSEIQLRQIIKENFQAIKLIIPGNNTLGFELELSKASIGGDYINVTLKGNGEPVKKKIKSGLHYRGIIKGDVESYAAISIHENSITGIISNKAGNFVLSKLKNSKNQYVFYSERDLINRKTAKCLTSDEIGSLTNNMKKGISNTLATNSDCKVVKCYYECDYEMYVDFSNDDVAAATFIEDAFVQVATLYYNEGVICEISDVVVWTGSDFVRDKYPYQGFPQADIFPVLSTIIAEKGSSFPGDIANFITTRDDIHPCCPPYGLAAKIGTLCNKYLSHTFINLDEQDLTFNVFPNYCDVVQVMAHEMGHVLGSPHTHACFWNGNNTVIDGCAAPEGGCTQGSVPGSGTVMSYCNFHPSSSIDFQNGFGSQPGGLIYDNVSNADCLNGSKEFIPINLSESSGIIEWDAVGGATDYTIEFKLDINDGCSYENQWIYMSTTSSNSYDLSNYTSFMDGSDYLWRVKADCSPFSEVSAFSLALSSNSSPQATVVYDIYGTSATLCWEKCSGVSTYDVRYRNVGEPTWMYTVNSISNNYKRIYGPGGLLEWQVKSSSGSSWYSGSNFTLTSGDNDILNPPYCSVNGVNNNDYYIDNVEMSGQYYGNINSGPSSGGYEHYDDGNSYLLPGESINITAISPSSTDEIFITLFVDLNDDADYTDEGEDLYRYFGVIGTSSPTLSLPCGLPNKFINGYTFMRMAYIRPIGTDVAPAQCNVIGDGEVEDYTVFLDPLFICSSPRLSFEGLTDISIFPNPSTDFTKITAPNRSKEGKQFASIYNLTGQIVKKVELTERTTIINVKDIAKGFYLISISENNNLLKKTKFIKL